MKRGQHSECGSCNSKQQRLLHNIPQRGIYRRLCTSCVLKLHPGLFCPNCFAVYEGSNPPSNGVTCLKCLSVAHLACVSKENASRYVCPTCVNPSHVFFDLNKKSKDGNGESVPNENHVVINLNMAKVLLAAAQIASITMSKAASGARIEAERRAKEAALTRKRAIEALERVNFLDLKEKENKAMEMMGKEIVQSSVKENNGKEMMGKEIVQSCSVKENNGKEMMGKEIVQSSVKENNGKEMMGKEIVQSSVVAEQQKKKPRRKSAVAAAVAAQKRFQNQVIMALNDGKDKDKSGEAPVNLDNVVSRAKEMSVGSNAPNLEQKPPTNRVMGNQQLQNHVTVNGKENSSNLSHSLNNVAQGEKETNGLVSVAHGVEENQGKSKEFEDTKMVPQLTHSNKGSSKTAS